MTLSRVPRPVLFLTAAAAVYLAFVLLHVGVAHAADTPPLPPVPGVDWSVVLLGVIAGLSAIRTFLVFIAPRTTTTVDDRALAVINAALSLFVERHPIPVVPDATVKRDPQSGRVAGWILAVIATFGAISYGAYFATGCATARPIAANVATAELDCTSGAMVDVVKSLGNAAQTYLTGKIAGDGRTVDTAAIKADLRALGSKAWSCALTVALNVVLGQPAARTSVAVALGPDWRGVLTGVKTELGVTAVRLPDGSVL